MSKRKRKPEKRLTVISRRQEWDPDAFAKAVAAYVIYQLNQQTVAEPVRRVEDAS